jgi:hypothetical protein
MHLGNFLRQGRKHLVNWYTKAEHEGGMGLRNLNDAANFHGL